MCAYTKIFRVAAFSDTGRADGTYHCVMVAADGACWQVVTGGDGSVLRLPGEDVEVSLAVVFTMQPFIRPVSLGTADSVIP